MKCRLVTSVFVLGALTTSAHGALRYMDCVTITGGSYVISPGIWTLDGREIGRTWIGGGAMEGAGTVWSFVKLPQVPNDWHYGVDTYTDPNGNVTRISDWAFWNTPLGVNPFEFTLYAGSADLTEIDLTYTFDVQPSDGTLVVIIDTIEVYDGPEPDFNPADFNLTEIGNRAISRVEVGVPTVSEWGLIVTTLLLLTAGTIVIGRRRRPAAG